MKRFSGNMRGKVTLCDKTTFTVSYKNYKNKTKTKSCTVNAKRNIWPTRGCLIKKVRSLGMAQVNVVCSSKKAITPLTWHGTEMNVTCNTDNNQLQCTEKK